MYLAVVAVLLLLNTVPSWQQQQQQQDPIMQSKLSQEYPHGQSELVFLLDGSGSIGPNDFGVQLFFVQSLLTEFSIGPDATRVAVVSYGDDVTRHIDHIAGESGNKCRFLSDLKNVKYVGGSSTNIAGALGEAIKIFTHSRPRVNRAVILLSDGVSNTGGNPVAVADQLRADGVEIFSIGVGLFDRTQLQRIAGSTEHFFAYHSFDNFQRLALRIRGDPRETMYDDSVNQTLCDSLCHQPFPEAGKGCCDLTARCACSMVGGRHECVCGPGTYGRNGFLFHCKLCPRGTYKSTYAPTDRCTPCPLESTTTTKGSTTLGACYCKEGFEGDPAGGVACRLTTCGRLTSPEHGQILPRDCSNKYQSVCSFECDLGYELVDSASAKRRCKADGYWTETVAQCRKVRCPDLAKPANGLVNCQNQEVGGRNVYGTVCGFSCSAGHNPVGSRQRTCTETGEWSGEEFRCRAITCSALPQLNRGDLVPSTCATKRQPVKTGMCIFKCNEGFRLEGPKFKRCEVSGDWSHAEEEVSCVDAIPPTISCPSSVEREADPGFASTKVSWELPTVLDNLDGTSDLVVTSSPAGIASPHTFPIGVTVVSYTVTDKAGLSSGCAFKVTVQDKQPPTVEGCPGYQDKTSKKKRTAVWWDEPTFADNSEEELKIFASNSPGDVLSWGTHAVIYTATDAAGQSAECRFTIRIGPLNCPNHPEPRNGARACDQWLMGQFCRVYCNQAYEFAEKPAGYYICTQGAWTTIPPRYSIPWPDCSAKFPPDGVRQPGMETRYYAGDCTQEKTMRAIKEAFVADFRKSIIGQSGGCKFANSCTVDAVTVYCGEIDEGKRRRRRRRRGAGQGGGDTAREDLSNIVTVVFTLSTRIRSPDQDKANHQNQLANAVQTMRDLSRDFERLAQAGQLQLVVENQTLPMVEGSFAGNQTVPLCRNGSMVLDDTECQSCAVGSYVDAATQACKVCPAGTYQDEEGQDRCKPCPEGTWTEESQSKDIGDCRSKCRPGTVSPSGLSTCRSCQRGSYQPSSMQTECLPCAEGTTTPTKGSRSQDDCQAVCQPGTFSATGLHPCQPCPLASYQPERQQNRCLPCAGSGTTTVAGATSEEQCQVINACESTPCRHGAQCTSYRGAFHCQCAGGFTGATCETEIDECRSQPCLFNATCIDRIGGFDCACAPGYEGALCEVESNECSSDPCQNDAMCQDQIAGFECDCVDGFWGSRCELPPDPCAHGACLNGALCVATPGSFRCTCPLGFHGVRCEKDRDECDGQPCQNGGSCENTPGSYHCACVPGYEGTHCELNVDDCLRHSCANGSTCRDVTGGYQCVCPPGVAGRHCETEMSQEFLLNFNSSLTGDFSLLRTGHPGFRAVTLSMWLRPARSTNMGTPISYAADRPVNSSTGGTSLVDNALTVTDCASLKIYVNGGVAFTDATVNNGWWNSLVFTWTIAGGEWRLYLNGSRVAYGAGLSTDVIPGGGAFVLGQEQDSVGGSFSSREAYLGDVYKLNVWDRVLADDEIQAASSNCGWNQGNVIAWSDFLAGLAGGLVPLPRDATAEVPDCPAYRPTPAAAP